LSNNIFSDLRDLDHELAKIPSGSQYDEARSQWYSRLFNSVNWLSFMVNEKVISDKKMVEHIKGIIVRYYEGAFLKNASVDERVAKSYQEFKKLYRTIK
jgi:L-asparaginase II